MIRYFSDPHFGHANIITYCDRPFDDVDAQDEHIWAGLAAADAAGDALVCLGDWSFHDAKLPLFAHPERHTLLFGNHDREPKRHYAQWFRQLIGKRATYKRHYAIQVDGGVKLLLTHSPMQDLHGCDYNLHGHIHNAYTKGDFELPNWLLTSDRHLNISVECIDYRPRSLTELLQMRTLNPLALR